MYILRLVLFPLYFTKFSLNTVSIRVKFGSSKEKITTRRMYIYLISFTYQSFKKLIIRKILVITLKALFYDSYPKYSFKLILSDNLAKFARLLSQIKLRNRLLENISQSDSYRNGSLQPIHLRTRPNSLDIISLTDSLEQGKNITNN